tara:strand:- start:205 stop:432 length:228 start_codon:yes stop_codon:yes gene_type:complete
MSTLSNNFQFHDPKEPDTFSVVELKTGRIYEAYADAEKAVRTMAFLNEKFRDINDEETYLTDVYVIKINYYELYR